MTRKKKYTLTFEGMEATAQRPSVVSSACKNNGERQDEDAACVGEFWVSRELCEVMTAAFLLPPRENQTQRPTPSFT